MLDLKQVRISCQPNRPTGERTHCRAVVFEQLHAPELCYGASLILDRLLCGDQVHGGVCGIDRCA
jgi:hypothetical protein